MTVFHSLVSRFSALLRRQEWDDRVDEELQFHIGMEIEENIRRGMAPRNARAAAHRQLGNRTQVASVSILGGLHHEYRLEKIPA